MAISISQLYAGGSTNGSAESFFNSVTSFSPAAFTPGNNCLLVVAISAAQNVTSTLTSISLSGGGYTWTRQGSVSGIDTISAGYTGAKIIFTAPVTTGTSTTLTCSGWTSGTDCAYYVEAYQITGYNTSSFLGATALANNNSSTAPTLTLSGSPASTSLIFSSTQAVPADFNATGVTVGTGFSALASNSGSTGYCCCGSEYRTGTTSTSVPWAGIINGSTIHGSTLSVVSAFEIIAAPDDPTQDFGFLQTRSELLKHPATLDTNQPRDNMFMGWGKPTPSSLAFWFQPLFLGPTPKSTQNTNQPFYISPKEPKTPTAFWLKPPAFDVQCRVPTIYTAQSFLCNPTIGPPVSSTSFWTQPPDLLKHPNTLDTNQPLADTYAGWNITTPVVSGFWTQPNDLLRHPATIDTNQRFTPQPPAGLSAPIQQLATGVTTYTGSSFTVGSSFTPPDGSLLVAVVSIAGIGTQTGSFASMTLSGGGLTWTQQLSKSSFAFNTAGVAVFTAPVTTGSSTTISASSVPSFATSSKYDVVVYAFTGYNAATPVGANATGTSTTAGAISITLSAAPASTSDIIAGLCIFPANTGGTSTQGAGWTQLRNVTSASLCVESQWITGSTSTTVPWQTQISGDTVQEAVQWALEIEAAGASSNPTPSDCSFLFEPNALLNHPLTLDTNQSRVSYQDQATPSPLGFWTQAQDLLCHPKTVDTNQPLDQGWTKDLTPASLAFYKQPENLLRHPATVDTNQGFDAGFAGQANTTPSSLGFLTQAPDLLRHPNTVDTNQPLDDTFAGWTNLTPASLGFWRQPQDLLRHPVTLDTRQPFEFNPPTPALTPADCSFLFQPSESLHHPATVDTNQPLDDAFFGWAQNITPTALGFWAQAPALLKHPATVDTNQAFVFNPPPPASTPADCSFLFEPAALLNHASTLDTNQPLDDTFSGWTGALATPTALGFWRQPENLLRHPNTIDTNQSRVSYQDKATPSSFAFWAQPQDLLRHPATIDTNQPLDDTFVGWTVITPSQLGFWVQAPDLLRHPSTLDTNQPRDNMFSGWAQNITPTSFGFFVQAPNLLRHANTLDTNQAFVFSPPAPALTPANCAMVFQPSALLRHPNTVDTNQPLDDAFAGWTGARATPTALGFWTQAPDLIRHPSTYILGGQYSFVILPPKATGNAIIKVYFFN